MKIRLPAIARTAATPLYRAIERYLARRDAPNPAVPIASADELPEAACYLLAGYPGKHRFASYAFYIPFTQREAAFNCSAFHGELSALFELTTVSIISGMPNAHDLARFSKNYFLPYLPGAPKHCREAGPQQSVWTAYADALYARRVRENAVAC